MIEQAVADIFPVQESPGSQLTDAVAVPMEEHDEDVHVQEVS